MRVKDNCHSVKPHAALGKSGMSGEEFATVTNRWRCRFGKLASSYYSSYFILLKLEMKVFVKFFTAFVKQDAFPQTAHTISHKTLQLM